MSYRGRQEGEARSKWLGRSRAGRPSMARRLLLFLALAVQMTASGIWQIQLDRGSISEWHHSRKSVSREESSRMSDGAGFSDPFDPQLGLGTTLMVPPLEYSSRQMIEPYGLAPGAGVMPNPQSLGVVTQQPMIPPVPRPPQMVPAVPSAPPRGSLPAPP